MQSDSLWRFEMSGGSYLITLYNLHPHLSEFSKGVTIFEKAHCVCSGASLLLFFMAIILLFIMLRPQLIDAPRSECGKITQTLSLNRCYLVESNATQY